jgi:hypothetical protein
MDQLLRNDREANNEITAIAAQQHRKYSTVLEPLLGSDPLETMEVRLNAVFSMWYAPRLTREQQIKQNFDTLVPILLFF